jgi:hypothetical protein
MFIGPYVQSKTNFVDYISKYKTNEKIEANYEYGSVPNYNETNQNLKQINPMYDASNPASKGFNPNFFDSVTKKNPDYTIRIQGTRKFFVEAKKVSIDLEKSNKPAFQTRRYGWNANLGISILTNFETLSVYDCRHKPNAEDATSVARYKSFQFSEYLSKFDELYQLLSFQSVASGYIDEYFAVTQKETTTFDDYLHTGFFRFYQQYKNTTYYNLLFGIHSFYNIYRFFLKLFIRNLYFMVIHFL